ncbi:MAG: hypothetical protein MUC65_00705 [Pontiellaceae bacterium]|nr:hypothetical protein [Pontiellaceae bacterium]
MLAGEFVNHKGSQRAQRVDAVSSPRFPNEENVFSRKGAQEHKIPGEAYPQSKKNMIKIFSAEKVPISGKKGHSFPRKGMGWKEKKYSWVVHFG